MALLYPFLWRCSTPPSPFLQASGKGLANSEFTGGKALDFTSQIDVEKLGDSNRLLKPTDSVAILEGPAGGKSLIFSAPL